MTSFSLASQLNLRRALARPIRRFQSQSLHSFSTYSTMARRQGAVASLLVAIMLIISPQPSQSLAWRLFAGREECFSDHISDSQWKYIQNHEEHPDQAPVYVDLGFLVTSKYGTEEAKAAVDYTLYAPNGEILKSETDVSEVEYGTKAKGGLGPWKVCFKISSGALLRPSVNVQITYFLINYEEYMGDGFDWEDHPHKLEPADLGTKEQIESLEHGLLRLDHYLLNVTNEQRFLYQRTVRHLRTAESTLRRTFWYYTALYSVICLASFSQLYAVRLMFKKRWKHGGGLII